LARILIAYGSRYGQTRAIADRIAEGLRRHAHVADVVSTRQRPAKLDPRGFDAVIVGAPVYAGRFLSHTAAWIRRWDWALAEMPCAFFSVSGAEASPQAAERAQIEALTQRLLAPLWCRPAPVENFAGAIVYTRYNWLLRRVMKQIVGRSGGDTDTRRDHEYTDWNSVERFADAFAAKLSAGTAAAGDAAAPPHERKHRSSDAEPRA
jgi:menaquinone-dependent protoporphyrinogen oxidase